MLQHPESLTVSVGEWSNFTCTIDCSERHSLRWRLAVPTTGLLNGPYIRSGYFNRFGAKNGITIESVGKEENSCRSPGGEVTEVIRIMATNKSNGAVIQCAAIRIGESQDYFSKFALLVVEENSGMMC